MPLVAYYGDCTMTERTTTVVSMWPCISICSQIPKNYIARPVAYNIDHHSFHHWCYRGSSTARAIDYHLFRKENVFVRTHLMNSSHARVIAHVLMKSHTRSILRHFWVTENGERIIRTVAVMVEQYDLGRDSIFSELRSEIVGNELSLFLRCPCHARCIARIERFVLYCKG